MDGRIVLITGGGSGIGRETALLFAQKGAKAVVVGDINYAKAEEVAEEISRSGSLGKALHLDVGDPASIEEGFANISSAFGQLDVLVNCAGICLLTPFEEITLEEWNKVIGINLTGTFLCCQKAVSHMAAGKTTGSIINIASVAAKVGGLFSGAHYSASKAGVSCLTMAAAKYAAKYGIRVNAVAPSFIDTEMTHFWDDNVKNSIRAGIPLGFFGQPIDIANAVYFLSSPEARYITGEILDVNGGSYTD